MNAKRTMLSNEPLGDVTHLVEREFNGISKGVNYFKVHLKIKLKKKKPDVRIVPLSGSWGFPVCDSSQR